MESGSPDNGVLCARCGISNPANLLVCRNCGTCLWAWCPRCEHRNERTLSRCANCGKSLASANGRRRHLVFLQIIHQLKPAYLLLILILAVVIAALVMMLANLGSPSR